MGGRNSESGRLDTKTAGEQQRAAGVVNEEIASGWHVGPATVDAPLPQPPFNEQVFSQSMALSQSGLSQSMFEAVMPLSRSPCEWLILRWIVGAARSVLILAAALIGLTKIEIKTTSTHTAHPKADVRGNCLFFKTIISRSGYQVTT
jgi:hypothetical protein